MNLKIGDLVQIPLSFDVGVILSIKKHQVHDIDLSYYNGEEILAEVYWQELGKTRLETLKDLVKVKQQKEKT